MPIISYAQNREDVLLRRALPGAAGFYIDVGASHPIHHSVTKHFHERGWHGINVEPLPGMFELIRADRPGDVNLNIGLGRAAGTLTFHEAPACDGWSTFSTELAAELRARGTLIVEHRLPIRTLADVCADFVREPIDFLKIDVEGSEKDVIEGADWRRWRPRVVLVEATEQNSAQPNHHAWEPLLLAADYLFATFDGLNRFYVRAEDRALAAVLAVPPNVFDEFVPYEHVREVLDLRRQLGQTTYERDQLAARMAGLADFDRAGPMARKAARAVTGMTQRFPWLAGAVKSLLRRAG